MIGLTWIHVGSGAVALLAGAVAVAVRKGGPLHIRAGTWFCMSMFALGITAAILEPLKTPPESPIGGLMVCYFVATAWLAARRSVPGRLEKLACASVLAISLAMIGSGVTLARSPLPHAGPPGPSVLIALGALCLLAGLGDLRFIVRGQSTAVQRITRHLWRMCFALFIATGSFFLGQQKVMPQAMHGSRILFALAFAPFALMLFWLVRVRFANPLTRAMKPLDMVSGVLTGDRRHE